MVGIEFAVRIGLGGKRVGPMRVVGFILIPKLSVQIDGNLFLSLRTKLKVYDVY